MFKHSEGRVAHLKDKVVAGGRAIRAKIKDTVGDSPKKIATHAMKSALRGALDEVNDLVEKSEKKAKKLAKT